MLNKLTFDQIEIEKIYFLYTSSSLGGIQVELTNKFLFDEEAKSVLLKEIQPTFVYVIDKYKIPGKDGITDENNYECYTFLTKNEICSTWFNNSEGLYVIKSD